MWASGVFADYPDIELIDGVIYKMPADGPRTIDWNAKLARRLYDVVSKALTIVPDKTLDLSPYGGPKPDFYIHDRASAEDVNGRNVLLVIEVSDTTLNWDRDVKTRIYAEGGVREYWLVDCVHRQIRVHRLAGGRYGEPRILGFDETAEALLVPGLTVRL